MTKLARLVLCGVLMFLPLQLPAQTAPSSDAVLARVDNQPVTQADLEFLYLSRRIKPDQREALRERYLDELIDRTLLRQFLAGRKVQVSRALVDERIDRLKVLLERESLDFDETLKSLGFTRQKLHEEMSLPLAWQSHARLAITDDSIRRYWDQHRPEYDGTEVRAAHIVKRLPKDGSLEEIKRITGELKELAGRIRAGSVTFAAAAKEYSDSLSGQDGGDLGAFSYRGRMPLEFSRVAFALKPGEISEPFQTPFGLHILTVTEVIPGDLSLEDARSSIFAALSTELQSRLLEQLRSKAKIERTPPTL